MKLFKHGVVTKRYAVKAALYRRIAKSQCNQFKYDEACLVEMFQYESLGIKDSKSFDEMKKYNGYAYGKWVRDLDVVQMKTDIMSGDFCKYEFVNTALLRIHNKKILETIVSPTWFPYIR